MSITYGKKKNNTANLSHLPNETLNIPHALCHKSAAGMAAKSHTSSKPKVGTGEHTQQGKSYLGGGSVLLIENKKQLVTLEGGKTQHFM